MCACWFGARDVSEQMIVLKKNIKGSQVWDQFRIVDDTNDEEVYM